MAWPAKPVTKVMDSTKFEHNPSLKLNHVIIAPMQPSHLGKSKDTLDNM
jgi:hypothetical protein